ncbi:Ulp1 protease family carboxy-terminal domain protein [Trifolium medium]|uniref:Ulp1 protease family carboxy-terminal domain protein n=1 Tax=Trifolium medium TaxID=97028 RepID=A0A392NEH6_9FABA|nr:Ulp1 protease family carboxy-terminal domain protein [Trifolium medium]
MKCAFKTTSDMLLDHVEIRVCAYVFQEDFDTRQVIILMMAFKVTLNQHNALSKTVWCLPPSFADDVGKGNSIEALHEFYSKDWMRRFDRLQHIYVPIEETRGHWYLMVISIDDQKIYQLDSHPRDDLVEGRQRTIRNIVCIVTVFDNLTKRYLLT